MRAIRAATEPARDTAPIALDLRAIAPRPVPSVVLSLAAKSVQEIARLLQSIPGRLDDTVAKYPVKIEVRADLLTGFAERMTGTALVLQLGVPIVVTLRARAEGGAAVLTEPERQRFYLSLVSGLRGAPPPGSLIDVEAAAVAADPGGWGQVFAAARERGFHVMLSHHEFERPPGEEPRLLADEGLLDAAPGGPALVWKSATTVRTLGDELAVLAALRRGNAARRRAVVIGMGSPVSRLLAPFFGAPLVYASVDPEAATAPGQMPFDALTHTWARWGISVDDAVLAEPGEGGGSPPRWMLLGRPAWHSLSPAMHNAAARAHDLPHRYFPFEIPEGAEDPVREVLMSASDLGVVAGNATVPFKAELAQTADTLLPDADALGVANTFRFQGGRLEATNTDPAGVRRALEEAGAEITGSKVLVLGAGGSAVAALQGTRDAASRTVVNRTRERADEIVERLGDNVMVTAWGDRAAAARKADVIIHCTTIGMTGGPVPDETPLPADALKGEKTVLDLVYVPRATPLLIAARAGGARVIDGTAVLLHQGAEAFRYWTGREPPIDVMREAIAQAERIPLPGSLRRRPAGEST